MPPTNTDTGPMIDGALDSSPGDGAMDSGAVDSGVADSGAVDGSSDATAGPVDGAMDAGPTESVVLRAASSLMNFSTVGVPNDSDLAANVKDGTSFAAADDAASYVRSDRSVVMMRHRLSYESRPPLPRPARTLIVHTKIRADNTMGNFSVELFDGATSLGTVTGPSLGVVWQEFSLPFDGAGFGIQNLAALETELTLDNQTSLGSLQYTIMWLEVRY